MNGAFNYVNIVTLQTGDVQLSTDKQQGGF